MHGKEQETSFVAVCYDKRDCLFITFDYPPNQTPNDMIFVCRMIDYQTR